MNLNVLLRGQSNAVILGQQLGGSGKQVIVAEVERLLGFDGITNTVTLEFAAYDPSGRNTAVGGTGLLGDWLSPVNGDWQQGWTVNPLEQGLLDYIATNISTAEKADPTAVVWLHSEYDSARNGLTPAEWESALRFDAALVRQAFGRSDIPYVFIEPIPYASGTDAGTQAIRLGMQALAADAAFNGRIGAQASDLNMDDTIFGGIGGHMSVEDTLTVALRTARSLAELWSPYALPGSPVDLADGNIDNTGPLAVQAVAVGTQQLSVSFVFDRANGFRDLDADAAAGVGWSVRVGDTVLQAISLAVTGQNTALLTFAGDLPENGRLYYNYGIGRLTGADGTGQGNALYDDQNLPVHTPASGLLIGAAALTPGATQTGTDGADTLSAGPNGDTINSGLGNDYMLGGAGADTFVLAAGDGLDWMDNFAPGQDHLRFGSGILAGAVTTQVQVIEGVSGLAVSYTPNDVVFLANVTALQPGDLIFTAPPPAVPELILGTPQRDLIGAGAGGDTVIGGQGDDYMVAGVGADVFGINPGDGQDWIDNFAPGTDRIQFGSGMTAGDIRLDTFTIEGITGLALLYGPGNDFVFLARVTALQPGDLVFAALPGGAETLTGTQGADVMVGGPGNTTFIVNNTGDVTTEAAGGGTDTVNASVGFNLAANVENLAVVAGAGGIFGIGNELANAMTGNEGANLLVAGIGNDSLSGGAGNDSLFGETGDDSLSGGAGSDYLEGGAGNDTYLVDATVDLIVEVVGGGTDTVLADLGAAGYYLGANVENLTLLGTTAFGVGNALGNALTGSAAANWLLGGAGDDTLDGKAGNDMLVGEAGADTFAFARGTGADVVGDFAVGQDHILLSGLGFTSLAQVKAAATEAGGNVTIDLGQGDLVRIDGVALAALTANDFLFA